jgi:PAS domain S-box-containing protein
MSAPSCEITDRRPRQAHALRFVDLDEDLVLRRILEGTAASTGAGFFAALVLNLAHVLKTHGAWVTELLGETRRLRALAFWAGGHWIEDYEYDLAGSPCEVVVEGRALVHYPDSVLTLYPDDPDMKGAGAVSYLGVPLLNSEGEVLGHLAVMDTAPMPEEPRLMAIFQIFAARATAELQRLRAEAGVRERKAQLDELVSGAMDAIVQLDAELQVTLMNPAAEQLFGYGPGQAVGLAFGGFLPDADRHQLTTLLRELESRPEGRRQQWIAGGLHAMRAGGGTFPAEATVSCSRTRGRTSYTLILRDVNERLEAERRIAALTRETEYLRDELKSVSRVGRVVGRSAPLQRLLRELEQVAATDATVLILGETGTGKELIARSVHEASPRRDKPLVTLNCAAIPQTLMESELFGHERGAFTGATQRREGRFALADGGTIFLDEIGELPLELQAKLLRVLQEGEVEPVGGSRTRKVDVRVIAATNRDLREETEAGRFREDLYFRLAVFPLQVPPLRERGDDIGLLAAAFVERHARKLGRVIAPLTPDCVQRLKAYHWPGNVRELENVIERAAIVAKGGRLDLDRALEGTAQDILTASAAAADQVPSTRVLTVDELKQLERDNLSRALEATAWKISGEGGAARLLGMQPSTLASRMKALGIARPS